MKTLQSLTLCLIVLAGLMLPPLCVAADEILSNASIVELQKMNLGDAVIIAKIKASKCNFDTSMDGLKQLKDANVSSPVIGAMLAASSSSGTAVTPPLANPNDPAAPHAAGVWALISTNGQSTMVQLGAEVPSEISRGGFIGPFGIGKVATTARLTGMTANVQLTQPRPEFYIYFNNAVMEFAGAGSPQQIVLAKFTVLNKDDKKNPNQRAVDVAIHGAYAGSYGVDRKAVRAFEATVVADGVYKMVPSADLTDGEYGFCSGLGAAAMTGRYPFYTFGIHSK